MTRIQLDDQSDEKSIIFGIVSSEADYKLSQLINKKLKIALKSINTIDLTGVDEMNISFSRYSDTSGSPEITYSLISNRSHKDCLLKKLKNIDYFFRISRVDNKHGEDQLISSLREIEKITAVFMLDPVAIKDKNLDYLTL